MGRRREERMRVILPVRVWGMDGQGKPFIASAHTVDITRTGGRLRNLFSLDRKGEIIRVQHGNQKSNFRVTWVGPPGTPEHGEIGISSLEPDKYIWGVELPRSGGADSYQAQQEPELITYDERGRVTPRTAPTATAGPAAAGATRRRRADARYSCAGTVEVAPEDMGMPVWCILSDLSVSGCYAETTNPLVLQTKIQMRVKAAGMEFQAKGSVRTSHPGVGMGIAFTAMNEMDRSRLEGYVADLRGQLESGVIKPRENAPTVSSVAPGSAAAGAKQPLSASDARVASARLDSGIMRRLTQLRSDLWEMQSAFEPNTLDSRLLREVKESVDRARHSIWLVQQWLELQAKQQDARPVLERLEAERIRVARELNRQMTIDIDSGGAQPHAEGLDDLYLAVRDLHNRLARLLNRVKL